MVEDNKTIFFGLILIDGLCLYESVEFFRGVINHSAMKQFESVQAIDSSHSP